MSGDFMPGLGKVRLWLLGIVLLVVGVLLVGLLYRVRNLNVASEALESEDSKKTEVNESTLSVTLEGVDDTLKGAASLAEKGGGAEEVIRVVNDLGLDREIQLLALARAFPDSSGGAKAIELGLSSMTQDKRRVCAITHAREFQGTKSGLEADLVVIESALDRKHDKSLVAESVSRIVKIKEVGNLQPRALEMLRCGLDLMGKPYLAIRLADVEDSRILEVVDSIGDALEAKNYGNYIAGTLDDFFAADAWSEKALLLDCAVKLSATLNGENAKKFSLAEMDVILDALIRGITRRAQKGHSYFNGSFAREDDFCNTILRSALEKIAPETPREPSGEKAASKALDYGRLLESAGLDIPAEKYYLRSFKLAGDLKLRRESCILLASIYRDKWKDRRLAAEVLESIVEDADTFLLAMLAQDYYYLEEYGKMVDTLQNCLAVEEDRVRRTNETFLLAIGLGRIGRVEEQCAIYRQLLDMSDQNTPLYGAVQKLLNAVEVCREQS